jgi:uncharacterized protein YkwD
LRSIRNARAALRAPHESVLPLLSRHRAATRVTLAAVAMAIVLGFSQQGAIRAGAEPAKASVTPRLLPTNIGAGIATDQNVTLHFDQAMDHASVADAVRISPAQPVSFGWSPDGTSVRIGPATRWQTDQRYLIEIPAATLTGWGTALGQAKRVSFTTQTAPTIVDFQLRFTPATLTSDPGMDARPDASSAKPETPPADTAALVSSRTSIRVAFSAPMDRAATSQSFAMSPAVPGALTWAGNVLSFEPAKPLAANRRYAVSLANARDARGNPLGGDTSFSFTTRDGAQVVAARPGADARNVTGTAVSFRFSQPMNAALAVAAFKVVDIASGARMPGKIRWNVARTQLSYTAASPFRAGHAYRVVLGSTARDADGHPVSYAYTFHAPKPAVVAPRPVAAAASAAPRPVVRPPAPSGSGVAYAIGQINAARAARGFAPLVLDAAVGAVANAHAWDMLRYNYFSHTGRDGSTIRTRLSAAGIPYTHAGENICEYTGIGVTATLQWCHGSFMSEPYPGYFNHIANILDPDFRRVGIGIATSGGKVIVVWDFAG